MDGSVDVFWRARISLLSVGRRLSSCDVLAGAVDAVHSFDPFAVERPPALVPVRAADEVEHDCRDATKIDKTRRLV
jgi:hypothetical protein